MQSTGKNPEKQTSQSGSVLESGAEEADHLFPVVGIGASAGGMSAFESFFAAVPADSGYAFVVVQHSTAQRESELGRILQRYTSMPVIQVTGATSLEPNRVYVIPPGRSSAINAGVLQVEERQKRSQRPTPIDDFLRTLSEDRGEQAVGVILSGTGADGTLGLKRIKERGGLVLVQALEDAEHRGMPQSVVESGLADVVAPAPELARRLVAAQRVEQQGLTWVDRLLGTNRNDETTKGETTEIAVTGENGVLTKILAEVQAHLGHDFRLYKQSTVLRRIGRRMRINGIEALDMYLDYLLAHRDEIDTLFKDFLISVTTFFRDPAAFDALAAQVIPRIFAGKQPNENVRIWVPGCATGEEAYSLAMLLHEARPPQVGFQIFATDLDERALATARDGVYPDVITADVSPERLARHFTKEGDRYRINEEIRRAVLFTRHNLISDPPFSRLQLISCRNLLIYFERHIQQRIFERFRFALDQHGFLFLGSSETVNGSERFQPIDKKHRIYQCNRGPERFVPGGIEPVGAIGMVQSTGDTVQKRAQPPLGELHRQLMLQRYAPPSLLVDSNYDVRYLFGDVGRYFRPAEGEPSHNLLQNIHAELRVELRAALFRIFQKNEAVQPRRITFSTEEKTETILFKAEPVHRSEYGENLALIVFEPVEQAEAPSNVMPVEDRTHDENAVAQLEDELQTTRRRLQTLIEEYETANEELMASNSELRSTNEELWSTTEELETSKEELQLTNEELHAVNAELKRKIDEVTRANSRLERYQKAVLARERQQAAVAELGMQALAGTSVHELMALAVEQIVAELEVPLCKVLELLPGEEEFLLKTGIGWQEGLVGEARVETRRHSQAGYTLFTNAPVIVKDLATETRFQGPALLTDHGVVSGISVVIQRNMQPYGVLGAHTIEKRNFTEQDAHFLQSMANVLGAAIERSIAYTDLQTSEDRFRDALKNSPIVFARVDRELRYEWVFNPHPDFVAEDVVGKRDDEIDAGAGVELLIQLKREVLKQAKQLRRVIAFERSDGVHYYDITATPVIDSNGQVRHLITAALDISERRRALQALSESKALFEAVLRNLPTGVIIAEAPSGRTILGNEQVATIFRHPYLPASEIQGYRAYKGFHADGTPIQPEEWPLARAIAHGEVTQDAEIGFERGDGSIGTLSVSAAPVYDDNGNISAGVVVFSDISERKQAEADLRRLTETLEDRIVERTAQIRMLASQLTLAEQRERRRISMILHDDLQQLLFAVQFQLRVLENAYDISDTAGGAELLKGVKEVVERSLKVTRTLSIDLSPPVLRGEGLVEAVRWLAAQMQELHGLHISVEADTTVASISAEMRVLIFHLVRELLLNVVKHAGVNQAYVRLNQQGGELTIHVEDKGSGFVFGALTSPPPGEIGGGLFHMQERLALFGGSLTVDTSPESGTKAIIQVPIDNERVILSTEESA